MADLPYEPRLGQRELVAAIAKAQKEGGHLVVEAGTGMGKTVCALAASHGTTAADSRRLVYATRTNSQQQQVVREHAALKAAGADAGLLIPFMGRRQYCPLLREDARFADGTPEELGRLCRDAKEKAVRQRDAGKPVDGACPYYARLLQDGTGPVEALLESGALEGPELASRITDARSCPYEALKALLPKARTVVVPLVFVLEDRLRATLLQWLGVGPDEVHVVLDEAHHVPEAAREHHSPKLTLATVQRAQREAEEFSDPVLAGTLLTTSLLDGLVRSLYALLEEHVPAASVDGEDPDGLVPPGALEEALLSALRLPSPILLRAVTDLEQWGEAIREDRRRKGRLPRSYLGAVAGFLRAWLSHWEAPFVHLASGGPNPALQMVLLDPAAVLGWLGEFWSTVHMSGTIAPVAEHASLCGLAPERTETLRLPSPFDPDRLRVVALEGVHRRWAAVQQDPRVVERHQQAAREALARLPGRTALFFPSHAMLESYQEEGFLHGIGRPVYAEKAAMPNADLARLVDGFRRERRPGALLLGVLGGRLSEGLDFPGEQLEGMLLFGVPYPRPSARQQALIHYFDAKSGNGWQVAVHTPVGRTMRQAVGRLIRGPEDRGTAVILDERAVRFRDHLRDLRMLKAVAELDEPQAPSPPHGSDYQTADRLRRPPSGTG